uniref:SHSP domain-containing protein n=1 Tax=Leersia perrieri TaxID=77586 RepID=A0A0D9XHX2_9ORYZ
MSTVTSCTFLSGRPAAMPVASLSKKPAPVVSLSSEGKSRPLSLCFAGDSPKGGDYNPKIDLPPFSISPVELVNPKPVVGERWQVEEKTDAVTLWFDVPGLSKEDLAVEIDEDVLIIKKKDIAKSSTPNSSTTTPATKNTVNASTATSGGKGAVYARLLLPAGYSKEGVEAELISGELRVTIAKVKESARRRINVEITVKPPSY